MQHRRLRAAHALLQQQIRRCNEGLKAGLGQACVCQSAFQMMQAIDPPVPLALEVEGRAQVVPQSLAQLAAVGREKFADGRQFEVACQPPRITRRPFAKPREVGGILHRGRWHEVTGDPHPVTLLKLRQQRGGQVAVWVIRLMEVMHHRLLPLQSPWHSGQAPSPVTQGRAGERSRQGTRDGCFQLRLLPTPVIRAAGVVIIVLPSAAVLAARRQVQRAEWVQTL